MVHEYLTALQAEILRLSVFPREVGAVSDKVVCSILSKAFSLADAALILIKTGHPEEAYGLSRSIVECSMNLRYLTQDQDQSEGRARDFANYFFREREYWYAQARQFVTDPALIAEIDQYAAENGIKADARATMTGWSGVSMWDMIQTNHPLDGTTFSLSNRKADYAVNYHSPAAYVHASYHAIHGYVVRLFDSTKRPYQPCLKSAGDEQEGQKTLYAILTHIHLATGYAVFAMDVTDLQAILSLYEQCLMQLSPPVQRHKPENVYRKIY